MEFFNTVRYQENGFTLIEMMICLGIVLFVSAEVLINFSSLNEASSLNRGAQELGFAIRRAQNMSFSVVAVGIGHPAVLQIPPSVGIRLSSVAGENKDYFFFSDLDISLNKKYDEPDERIEPNLVLPGNIHIKKITMQSGVTTPQAHIIFTTPEATVFLTNYDGTQQADELHVVLEGISGATRTVHILTSGQVTISNP